jgi:two-component system, cell cycle response regulator
LNAHHNVETATPISRPAFTIARAVLLVDDDELVRAHLTELVRAAGFEVHTAADGSSALAFLEGNFTPIVITDLSMPAMDGLALCRAIRGHTWPGYVYVLLLTVHDSESDILAGLEAGADDYMSKRASAAQLVARLHSAQRILGLEQALKSEVEEKRRQSLTDPLTGAHNRRYFDEHLQRDFKGAQRGGGPLSLLMLDIDHFKRINDRFGHPAGDAVLQEVVRRIAMCLPRKTDWCARVGGEEFVIVLGNTPLAGAAQVAERIRETIGGVPIPTPAGPIAATASMGVVECQAGANHEFRSVEALMHELDSNMYVSKLNGRNRVTLPAGASGGRQYSASPAMRPAAHAGRQPLRTLLYVDDEPDLRLLAQTALNLAAGLTVHTAESGEQALEMARELRPDLLLLDVMMPGLDGPGTLKRLRSDPAVARIPAIFITAKATQDNVARLRALGAAAVIAKPFDPMQLSAQVMSLWQTIAPQPQRVTSHDDDQARLRDEVARLAGKFLERTGVQAVTLEQLNESLQAGDSSGLVSMHEIAHKIHGSGATFNFPAVSACAGEIERLSENLLASKPAIDLDSETQIRRRLQASIQQLARAVQSAASGDAAK